MLAELDLVGMNLDSSDDAVQRRLGRSLPRIRDAWEHLMAEESAADTAG